MTPKLGDELELKPCWSQIGGCFKTGLNYKGPEITDKIIGKVVYIHPEKRFFRVAYKMGNNTVYECFQYIDLTEE